MWTYDQVKQARKMKRKSWSVKNNKKRGRKIF